MFWKQVAVSVMLSATAIVPIVYAPSVAAQTSGAEHAPITDAEIIAFFDRPEFHAEWDAAIDRLIQG